jgi:hypothetical protein
MTSKLYKESYKTLCNLLQLKVKSDPSILGTSSSDSIIQDMEKSVQACVDSIVRGATVLFKHLEEKQKNR